MATAFTKKYALPTAEQLDEVGSTKGVEFPIPQYGTLDDDIGTYVSERGKRERGDENQSEGLGNIFMENLVQSGKSIGSSFATAFGNYERGSMIEANIAQNQDYDRKDLQWDSFTGFLGSLPDWTAQSLGMAVPDVAGAIGAGVVTGGVGLTAYAGTSAFSFLRMQGSNYRMMRKWRPDAPTDAVWALSASLSILQAGIEQIGGLESAGAQKFLKNRTLLEVAEEMAESQSAKVLATPVGRMIMSSKNRGSAFAKGGLSEMMEETLQGASEVLYGASYGNQEYTGEELFEKLVADPMRALPAGGVMGSVFMTAEANGKTATSLPQVTEKEDNAIFAVQDTDGNLYTDTEAKQKSDQSFEQLRTELRPILGRATDGAVDQIKSMAYILSYASQVNHNEILLPNDFIDTLKIGYTESQTSQVDIDAINEIRNAGNMTPDQKGEAILSYVEERFGTESSIYQTIHGIGQMVEASEIARATDDIFSTIKRFVPKMKKDEHASWIGRMTETAERLAKRTQVVFLQSRKGADTQINIDPISYNELGDSFTRDDIARIFYEEPIVKVGNESFKIIADDHGLTFVQADASTQSFEGYFDDFLGMIIDNRGKGEVIGSEQRLAEEKALHALAERKIYMSQILDAYDNRAGNLDTQGQRGELGDNIELELAEAKHNAQEARIRGAEEASQLATDTFESQSRTKLLDRLRGIKKNKQLERARTVGRFSKEYDERLRRIDGRISRNLGHRGVNSIADLIGDAEARVLLSNIDALKRGNVGVVASSVTNNSTEEQMRLGADDIGVEPRGSYEMEDGMHYDFYDRETGANFDIRAGETLVDAHRRMLSGWDGKVPAGDVIVKGEGNIDTKFEEGDTRLSPADVQATITEKLAQYETASTRLEVSDNEILKLIDSIEMSMAKVDTAIDGIMIEETATSQTGARVLARELRTRNIDDVRGELDTLIAEEEGRQSLQNKPATELDSTQARTEAERLGVRYAGLQEDIDDDGNVIQRHTFNVDRSGADGTVIQADEGVVGAPLGGGGDLGGGFAPIGDETVEQALNRHIERARNDKLPWVAEFRRQQAGIRDGEGVARDTEKRVKKRLKSFEDEVTGVQQPSSMEKKAKRVAVKIERLTAEFRTELSKRASDIASERARIEKSAKTRRKTLEIRIRDSERDGNTGRAQTARLQLERLNSRVAEELSQVGEPMTSEQMDGLVTRFQALKTTELMPTTLGERLFEGGTSVEEAMAIKENEIRAEEARRRRDPDAPPSPYNSGTEGLFETRTDGDSAYIAGMYMPSNRTAFFFKGADTASVIHEFAHHARAILPSSMQTELLSMFNDTQDVPAQMWTEQADEWFAHTMTHWIISKQPPPNATKGQMGAFIMARNAVQKAYPEYQLREDVKEKLDQFFITVPDDNLVFGAQDVKEMMESMLYQDPPTHEMISRIINHRVASRFANPETEIGHPAQVNTMEQSAMYDMRSTNPAEERVMTDEERGDANRQLHAIASHEEVTSIARDMFSDPTLTINQLTDEEFLLLLDVVKMTDTTKNSAVSIKATEDGRTLFEHTKNTEPKKGSQRILANQTYANKLLQRAKRRFNKSGTFALWTISSMESIMKVLDGFRDTGIWHNLIYKPLIAHRNNRVTLQRKFEKSFDEKIKGAGINMRKLQSQRIQIGEYEYTKGEVMFMAIVNRMRPQDIDSFLRSNHADDIEFGRQLLAQSDTMTKADAEMESFVDALQSIYQEIHPQLAKVYQEVTGKEMGQLNFYVPFIRTNQWDDLDDVMSKLNAVDKRGEDHYRSTTSRMQERLGGEGGKIDTTDPFGQTVRYINQASAYIAMAPVVQQVQTTLQTQDVIDALRWKYGQGIEGESIDYQFIHKMVSDLVMGELFYDARIKPMSQSEVAMRNFRTRFSMFALAGNIMTSVKQVLSFPLGVVRSGHMTPVLLRSIGNAFAIAPQALSNSLYNVGLFVTGRGTTQDYKHVLAGTHIYENWGKYSPVLLNRHGNPETGEAYNYNFKGLMGIEVSGYPLGEALMAGISTVDALTVGVLWESTFESWTAQYKKEGMAEEEAMEKASQMADQMIRDTQPPSLPQDRNMLQRGNEWTRSLFMFTGATMRQYEVFATDILGRSTKALKDAKKNGITELTKVMFSGQDLQTGLIQQMGLGFLLPAVIYGMLSRRREPTERELMYDIIAYPFSAMPFARGVAGVLAGLEAGHGDASTYYERFVTEVYQGIEASARVAYGEGWTGKNIDEAIDAMSLLTSTPKFVGRLASKATQTAVNGTDFLDELKRDYVDPYDTTREF